MLPVHRTLSIVPTFQCNASCSDCGTFSSPEVKGTICEQSAKNLIDEAKTLGFEVVVITGGEPSLRWNLTNRLIKHASDLGLRTRLVSNAVWAISKEKASFQIGRLIENGLNEINFSTGDEHIKYIPIQNVARAVLACFEHSIEHRTMFEGRQGSTFCVEDFLDCFPEKFRVNVKERVTLSPWMPISPFHEYNYDSNTPTANKSNSIQFLGCDSVLGTYVAYPNGQIASCCGLGSRRIPELHAGNFDSQDNPLKSAIVESEDDLLKLAMHYFGPFKILEWAQDINPNIDWEDKFAHKCQACAKIYQDPTVKDAVIDAIKSHSSDIEFLSFLSIASAVESSRSN